MFKNYLIKLNLTQFITSLRWRWQKKTSCHLCKRSWDNNRHTRSFIWFNLIRHYKRHHSYLFSIRRSWSHVRFRFRASNNENFTWYSTRQTNINDQCYMSKSGRGGRGGGSGGRGGRGVSGGWSSFKSRCEVNLKYRNSWFIQILDIKRYVHIEFSWKQSF